MYALVQFADPLFLFACRALWLHEGNQEALRILQAAARTGDPDTRAFAQALVNGICVPSQTN